MIINQDFKTFYPEFISAFSKEYEECIKSVTPHSLYDPLHYVMSHSGKQIRPAILAGTALSFKDMDLKEIIPAACSIEMIHNFTLIHDDIMDNDLLRHGMKTVHAKWGINEAILSGDGLFAIALQQLDYYTKEPQLYSKIMPLVLKAVTVVCEGQADDMEFETRNDVVLDEYLKMVEGKTAYLLAVSARLGALIADVDPEIEFLSEKIIRELGLVFQIQDDLLELTSNQENMGKTLGSDLIKQKKTFPYLFAKQEFDQNTWNEFQHRISEKYIVENGIDPAKELLENNFVFDRVREVITLRHDIIQEMIRMLPQRNRNMFTSMVKFVMNRKN
jgi:geranylgeranyl diphosphate synthase type II